MVWLRALKVATIVCKLWGTATGFPSVVLSTMALTYVCGSFYEETFTANGITLKYQYYILGDFLPTSNKNIRWDGPTDSPTSFYQSIV